MFPETHRTIPVQSIQEPLLREQAITLSVLRIDQTDPVISGNKWFKLKHNLIAARHQGYQTLLSFGGPYSNHIHALASAGKACGFNTIGIIRGEQHQPLNPTLSDAVAQGMKLYYVNRQTYRNKHNPEVIEQLKAMITKDAPFADQPGQTNPGLKMKHPQQFYVLPEGGTNELAIKGAAEIAAFIPANTDFVCVPVGTGGSAAGIISGLAKADQHHTKVLGFAAMKGGEFLEQTISSLLGKTKNSQSFPPWQLFYDYHFGGFGKINPALVRFIDEFETRHALELEPVYTGKMMYAIFDLIRNNYFPAGSKILALHTGGLQGKRGFQNQLQSLLSK